MRMLLLLLLLAGCEVADDKIDEQPERAPSHHEHVSDAELRAMVQRVEKEQRYEL